MTGRAATGALLAVFAHPDDESLAAGGLLALAADAGARVEVLCLTRGEAADANADDESRRALGTQRTHELEAAAQVLGLAGLEVLDHADGMLPWVDPMRLESDIGRAIRRLRPAVVVTFGPDGLYWHPDHIAVCDRTTAAVAATTGHVPALYYATLPPGQMRRVADETRDRGGPGWIIRGLEDPDAFGALAAAPTLVADVSRVAGRKLAALACHRSQTAGGALDMLTASDAPRLFGIEHYHRAGVGADGPTFIDRFAVAGAFRTTALE